MAAAPATAARAVQSVFSHVLRTHHSTHVSKIASKFALQNMRLPLKFIHWYPAGYPAALDCVSLDIRGVAYLIEVPTNNQSTPKIFSCLISCSLILFSGHSPVGVVPI